MRSWIEKQRHLIDFTLASLARRKGRNLGLLLVYGVLVFVLASAMLYTHALRHEAAVILEGSPEVVLQRLVAGRHDLIPPGYLDRIGRIRGVRLDLGALGVIVPMVESGEEAARLINDEEVKARALRNVEQNGIVFLDEIDKIASRSEMHGADVSRQGVQRDLLPLVEGTTVSTKFGMIKTDHILFIASGAFHLSKPSDLIPELQGRFPIRVELDSLSVDDFECILTQTDACLTRQYQALLGTEAVALEFAADGIRRLAEIAFQVNEKTENIGARRLYTVMEKLLEDLSFEAGRQDGQQLTVDAAYVDGRLGSLARDEDLSRYVL